MSNANLGKLGQPQISKQPHIAQAMPPPGNNFQSDRQMLDIASVES